LAILSAKTGQDRAGRQAQLLPPPSRWGRGFDSIIVVSQLRQLKVSKFRKLSCDLLACMAMPQSGQWRIEEPERDTISQKSMTFRPHKLI
jgi:hypothetical protein